MTPQRAISVVYRAPALIRVLRHDRAGARVLPSCGDPVCYQRWHRMRGWLMRKHPYPWQERGQ